MKLVKFFLIFSIFALAASDQSRNDYLDLVQRHPDIILPRGDASQGEIEIVTDPAKMASIEKSSNRDVGVVWRDKYWLWVNDAVRFPSGYEGIYARIIWVKSLTGPSGVAVMPVLPDGKIVLNCNFRHATRSWEIELPRGGMNPGETIEDAARRETLEETGMVVDSLMLLGTMPPDSGLTGAIVPVFVAHVIEKQTSQQEETEAIEEILALTRGEVEDAFKQGYYICTIRGKEKRVAVRDPFLAFALLKSAKERS
jgi:ADP-ribose pyrophosphatase